MLKERILRWKLFSLIPKLILDLEHLQGVKILEKEKEKQIFLGKLSRLVLKIEKLVPLQCSVLLLKVIFKIIGKPNLLTIVIITYPHLQMYLLRPKDISIVPMENSYLEHSIEDWDPRIHSLISFQTILTKKKLVINFKAKAFLTNSTIQFWRMI